MLAADVHEHVVVGVLQHQQVVDQRHEGGRALGHDQLGRLGRDHDLRRVARGDGLGRRRGIGLGVRLETDRRGDVGRRLRREGIGTRGPPRAVPRAVGDVQPVVAAIVDQRVRRVDHRLQRAVLDLAQHGVAVQHDQQRRAVTVEDLRRRGVEFLRRALLGLRAGQGFLQFVAREGEAARDAGLRQRGGERVGQFRRVGRETRPRDAQFERVKRAGEAVGGHVGLEPADAEHRVGVRFGPPGQGRAEADDLVAHLVHLRCVKGHRALLHGDRARPVLFLRQHGTRAKHEDEHPGECEACSVHVHTSLQVFGCRVTIGRAH